MNAASSLGGYDDVVKGAPIPAACAVRVQVDDVWVEAEGGCCEVDCETEGGAGGALGVPVVDGDALGVPVVDGVTLERVVLPIKVWVWVWVWTNTKE